MKKLTVTDIFAFGMLMLGGLNYGAIALFDLDVITIALGPRTLLSRALYLVILQSALYVGVVLHVLRKQHLTAS